MRPTKRSGHSSISVQKIWLMLLALVLIVAMMELSYTWLFTNTFSTSVSPGVVRFGGGDNDDIGGGGNLVQVQLRQGYSYRTSLVDGLRLNKAEVPQEADIIEDAGAGGDYKLEKNQSFASHGGRLNKTNTIRRGSNLSSSKRVAKTKAILTSIFLTTKSLTGGKTRDPKYHKEKKRNEMGQSKETEQAEFVGDSFKTVFERYQDEEIPMNQNWIVLDATSGNCIQHLSSGLPSGWKVMAVVQKPTTACKPPSCFFRTLAETVSRKPSLNEKERVFVKNAACLTVIARGARRIVLSHCTLPFRQTLQVLGFHPGGRQEHGLMYNQTVLFNPYSHFGAWAAVPKAWPRHTGHTGLSNSRLYFVRDFERVYVKHALSDSSPDITVVQGIAEKRGGGNFDPFTPPVFVGQDSLTPAVPVVSLYHQEAFWSLLLLPCESGLKSHILRQLVQQRLLRELDAFSAFYQLKAGTTNFSSAAIDVWDIGSLELEKLAADMTAWKCNAELKFLDCFLDLMNHLVKMGHVDQEKPGLVSQWIALYREGGGKEPSRVDKPWRGVRKTSEVRVALGSIKTKLEASEIDVEHDLLSSYRNTMLENCKNTKVAKDHSIDEWFSMAQWYNPLMKEIALIIVFNYNRFIVKNLPVLETIYRPFFKYIVFCLPDMDDLLSGKAAEALHHLILVEGLSDQWYAMYECLTIVAQMNLQGVKGYMQIGDDTLVNIWSLFNASHDKLIIPGGFTSMRADTDRHSWGWYWWPKSRGRLAVVKTLADIEAISGLSAQQVSMLDPEFNRTKTSYLASSKTVKTFSQCYSEGKASFPVLRPHLPGSESWPMPSKADSLKFLTNYYKMNRLAGRVKHRAIDLFYIPQTLAEDYIKWSHFFQSHGVIIELAVPGVHYGLANSHTGVTYVKASSVWNEDRSISYSFYDDSTFFLHPFKMSSDLNNSKKARDFFCDSYLKSLFLNLRKHNIRK